MTQSSRSDRLGPATFISVFFALQVALAFRYNINWDEYYFLSSIHAFDQGRLHEAFQTFHVELFRWLVGPPGTEAGQVVAGRVVMIICEAGSLLCLYRIAREFVSAKNALFAVSAWCAAGYALIHGASFRADPLAGLPMMAALAILMCGKLRWWEAAFAGVLSAVGILVTIKSVLFAPAFAGAFAWRLRKREERRSAVLAAAIALVTLGISWMSLWRLHSANLATMPGPAVPAVGTRGAVANVGAAAEKVFLSRGFLTRGEYVAEWAGLSMFPLALCAIGLWQAWSRRGEPGGSSRAIAVFLLAATLAALPVYDNAFPYFFPFIMLPAALAAALGAEAIGSPVLRNVLLLGMAVPVLVRFVTAWPQDQSAQREVARVAYELFPRPVRYIDRSGMLSAYPKSGPLLSVWGAESNFSARDDVLTNLIAREGPALLILNSPLLEDAVDPSKPSEFGHLPAREKAALRDNYVAHWGPVWVAGKHLGADDETFDLLVPGIYTLECRGSRMLDGSALSCGATAALERGGHTWGGGEATLRWGDHLPVPDEQPPAEPIFWGF